MACLFIAGIGGRAAGGNDLDLCSLEGALGHGGGFTVVVVGRGLDGEFGDWIDGHSAGVGDLCSRGTGGAILDKGDGGGEDAAAPLAGLDGASCEAAAVADLLNVEEDGEVGGAGEEEVTVAGVGEEVVGYGALSGGEAHGDYGTAVNATSSRRVPGFAGIGEDVLGAEVSILDGSYWWFCEVEKDWV